MANVAIRGDQLDAVLVAYVEWHRHEDAVRMAYRAWEHAARYERRRRYAAYLEELDREQRACELYAIALSRGLPAPMSHRAAA